MKIVLGSVPTGPPPIFPDEFVGKVPDEIDLASKGLKPIGFLDLRSVRPLYL